MKGHRTMIVAITPRVLVPVVLVYFTLRIYTRLSEVQWMCIVLLPLPMPDARTWESVMFLPACPRIRPSGQLLIISSGVRSTDPEENPRRRSPSIYIHIHRRIRRRRTRRSKRWWWRRRRRRRWRVRRYETFRGGARQHSHPLKT